MRRVGALLVAVGLLLGQAACFDGPVAAPTNLALDEGLVGTWQCGSVEGEPGERATLGVWSFDEHQYYAEWREGDDVSRFRAYFIEANGVRLLSLGDLSRGLWPWTALRYSISERSTLDIQLPARRILDMDDDKEAARVLKAEAGRADAWQVFAHCTKE